MSDEADKNQELRCLAALAAGYELRWSHEWPGGGCLMRRVVPEPEYPFSKWVPWRPLEDDEDALKLAVDCAMNIFTSARTVSGAACVAVSDCCRVSLAEDEGLDRHAAVRRVILRGAAEIGREDKQRSFSCAKKALLAAVEYRTDLAPGAQQGTDRIYISGPMTGLPDLNFPAFHAAAAALRAKGIDVINPAELNADNQGDWASCMKADIKALCDCTALALLPGWEDSRGAHLEVHLAHRLGMKVRKIEEFIGCPQ